MSSTISMMGPPSASLGDPALYVNRELSWLEFNARVLALAGEPDLPLLERCKFLAIFASNLDEFFMVRVAGIQDALAEGRRSSTPDQLPREVVLERIATRVRELVAEQGAIWTSVRAALADAGLAVVDSLDELGGAERQRAADRFEREILPVLTPLAVGAGGRFPYISGLSLNLGLSVTDPTSGESRLARVKVPPGIPRLLTFGDMWIPIEAVIEPNLGRVFPGMDLAGHVVFRLTRDADFEMSDEVEDLMGALEQELRQRRFGQAVRMEIGEGAPAAMVERLREVHELTDRDVYPIASTLDLTALWELANLDRPDLRERPWRARTQSRLRGDDQGETDLFAAIRGGDILVHHPYDDFSTSVQRFIEQAAVDPRVLAVKQTVYRTSGDSPIVAALMRAAEEGKQTVCLVELMARFDERRNIEWARRLEKAGVHVVYGEIGVKTHAKLCLVVRREGDRVRRYVHVGTGNYNASTARLYTDLGIFTCREDLAQDVAELFNHLTGFGRVPAFRKALVAPDQLRDGLIAEIERVSRAALRGEPARVVMKCNALIDGPIISALYRASQAGVSVDLIVRSIVGLRVGVPGVSENIRVRSIVGRFLEHSRIYGFTMGETTRYYIGSADIMVRNLDNRVEVVAPVEDPALGREVAAVIDVLLADTELAWELGPDMTWTRARAAGDGPAVNAHDALMERARRRDSEPLSK